MKCNVFHAPHSTTADRQQELWLRTAALPTVISNSAPYQHAVHSRNLVLLYKGTAEHRLHVRFTVLLYLRQMVTICETYRSNCL